MSLVVGRGHSQELSLMPPRRACAHSLHSMYIEGRLQLQGEPIYQLNNTFQSTPWACTVNTWHWKLALQNYSLNCIYLKSHPFYWFDSIAYFSWKTKLNKTKTSELTWSFLLIFFKSLAIISHQALIIMNWLRQRCEGEFMKKKKKKTNNFWHIYFPSNIIISLWERRQYEIFCSLQTSIQTSANRA